MARVLTPERKELKAHAITLRKQGWTEQAIASELGVSRECISDWIGNNGERGIVTNEQSSGNNGERGIVTSKNLSFRPFNGKLENCTTQWLSLAPLFSKGNI